MVSPLHHIWQQWKRKRNRRKLARLLQQHQRISREGMCLYAVVEDCMPTNLSASGMALLRVRLRIRLLDNKCIFPLSYVFITGSWRCLKGLSARVQFLAGDLSQVIIKI